MTGRLAGTGVQLRLVPDAASVIAEVEESDPFAGRALRRAHENAKLVLVETQVFAELDDAEGRYRLGGTIAGVHELPLDSDPTSELLRLAEEARAIHLGELLGDLRRAGLDISRWDFYAAPSRLELGADLRRQFAGGGLDLWSGPSGET